MAPTFSEGYYINFKGDTLRGEIQNNPEDPTSFYHQFSFKKGKSKPKMVNAQRTKGYGFDGIDFVAVNIEGEKFFVERLVSGRIKFYEYQFHGKVDGYAAIESEYYIKDTRAEGEDAELKTLKKISNKYYKKSLKPYLKDQEMIWQDLDKYSFSEQKVVETLNEFNRYYTQVGN